MAKNKTSYQQVANSYAAGSTDEWYTPRYITDALGEFDLDPCAARDIHQWIANKNWQLSMGMDGTQRDWSEHGRVWLNPPYSNVNPFIEKMCEHNNGIALLFNRQDTKIWQQRIAKTATAMLFLSGRVKFVQPDGTLKAGATCGSVLIAWGRENADTLRNSGLDGFYVEFMGGGK